jgi:ankyrin repeat protein
MRLFTLVTAIVCLSSIGCGSDKANTASGKPASPELTEQLNTAVMMGNGPEVTRLVGAGANVEVGKRDDTTPLLMAVFMDHKDVVERLLAAGAKIDAATSKGVTPLMSAVMFGKPEIAELLIDKGADVNARNSAGTSILVLAVTMKKEDLARRLIEKGADVNAQTGGHQTSALMMAAHEDLVETAKLLVAKGASATVKDSHGKSALDYANSEAMKATLAGGK